MSSEATEWACSVSPSEDGLIDGSYEVTITIADTYAHKTTDKVAIKIDNTPPVLVLQRPSTIFSSNSPDTYGQEFSLQGQSADDSDVGRIEVNVYRDAECTDYYDTIVLEKVPPTVDMTVMKWVETGESAYNKLYGSDKRAGTKKYYCTITVYDDARPCPDDGTGKGNSTDYYYLYNDIYTPILSKYKLTQVYSILNGTYKLDESADRSAVDTLSGVKEALASESLRTRKGSFALNPLNNPSFAFSGYDPLEKSESGVYNFAEVPVINGSMVTVKVSSGLDKIPLINDTIGIGLLPVNPADPLNEDGTIKAIGDEVVVFKPAVDKNGNVLIADEKDREDRASQIVNVGSYDRTVAVTLSKQAGLKIGGNYALNVTGYDENGNSALNNGILYGFNFISMGVAPELIAEVTTEPANDQNFVNWNGKIKITGTTKHEEGTPEYSVYLGEFIEQEPDKNRIADPITDTNIDLEFNAVDLFQGSDGVKKFIIRSAYDDIPIKLERTVTYDIQPPTVSVTSVSPVVKEYTYEGDKHENCVNGNNLTIVGNIFDKNGIESVSFKTKYKDKGADDSTAIEFDSGAKLDTDNASYFEIKNIDTTKAPDEKELIVIVSVKDRAGNVNDYDIKTNTTPAERYFIWQKSDIPVITFDSVNIVDSAEDSNISGFTKASNVFFTLSDDDGLLQGGEMRIYRSTDLANPIDSKDYSKADFSNNASSYTLPGDTGTYYISLTVNDMYGKSNTKTTYLKVESGEPSVEINSGNKAYITQTENGNKQLEYELKIDGEVVTGTGNEDKSFKIYISKDINDKTQWVELWDSRKNKDKDDKNLEEGAVDGVNNAISGTVEVTVSETFADGFTLEAGKTNGIFNVYLIATDARTTLKTAKPVTFSIDNDAPTIEFNLPEGLFKTVDSKTVTNNKGINYKGEATDGTGIEEIYYTVDGGAWALANGTKEWKFYEELPDGEHTLQVKAVDRANNNAVSTKYTFTVDATAPVISDVKLEGKNVTATVSDVGVGLQNVELYDDAIPVNTSYYTKTNSGDVYTFVLKTEAFSVGEHKFKVRATDKIGNINTVGDAEITIVAPTVATKLDSSDVTTTETQPKTKSYTFSFTVTDENGLEGTPYTLVVKKDGTVLALGTDYTVSGNIETTGVNANKKGTYTVEILDHTDGLYTYEIRGKDKYGVNSENVIRNVRLDTKGPEITFNSPTFTSDVSDWQQSTAVKVIGTATDDSGVLAVYYTTDSAATVPSSNTKTEAEWTGTSKKWKKATGTTSWSFTPAGYKEGDSNKVKVAAVDENGLVTLSEEKIIKIDTAYPVINSTKYKVGDAGTETDFFSGSTIYVNDTLNLSGTVSDTNGVNKIEVVAKCTGKDDVIKSIVASGTSHNWTAGFTVKDDATAGTTGDLSDGTWTITLTVTDVADKSTIATYTVVVDTAPPTLSPAYKSGTETFPAAWTNKTSVTVTTGAADTGSGLASAYYYAGTKSTTTDISENEWLPMVNTTGTTVTLFENAADQYIHLKVVDRAGNAATTKSSAFTIDTSKPSAEITSHANGSFIGSNADVVITISASDVISKLKPNDTTDATKSGVYVTVMNGSTTVGTYAATLDSGVYKATILSTALSALGRTVETIKVTAKATDNAGNSQDSSPIDLKFDRTNPTVTLRSPIASSTVNGKIEISGSASDDRMLKKVTLYRTPKTGETGTNVTIKTIDKDTSSAETKSLVAITGGLYEKEAANSWTISDFDTTTIASETLNNFEIYAVAEDDYGNKNYAVSKIKIDQHTDRPTITFSDLKLTTGEGSSKAPMSSSNYVWQINSLDVRGTITDDDGIAEFKYIVKSPSEAAPDETALAAGSSIPVNNGSWKITIPEENQGERVVYFYVKDTAGKSFYTKTSNDTSGIYLTDGNATYGTNETGYGSSVLYVKVDTNPPEASLEGATVASTIDENTTWTTTWASVKLGGTTTSFKFLVKAKDDNGIKSVNAKASGTCLSTAKEISSTLQKEKTFKVGGNTVTTDSDGKDNNGYSWYLFNVDCSTTNGFESGTLDFKVTVEDNAGTKSERTATFEIDYTVPVVRPNEVSTQLNGGGMVSLWGTVDTIQSKLYMAMSKSASDLPTDALVSGKSTAWDLVTESSGMSYYLYFDNDTSNPDKSHKQQLNNYLYNLGITTAEAVANNTYTDITNLYLWIKAVDLAGNVSTTSTMIRIDPQGDRPTIEISYPSTTTGTVGGELRIMGSATDNEAVSTVWVQVISKEHNYKIGTGTGEFNITGKTFRLGNTATPITNYTPTADDLDYMVHCGMSVYKFADYKESDSDANKAKLLWTDSSADRTNPELYAAKANFTGSTWNLIINDKGQFDPATGESNLVGITAYSVDAKTPKANVSLPTTVSVTFDADNPVISNLYLKQFSENTITANREYSDNNMYVKGVWYLTGTVSDTNGINGLTIGDDELVKEGAKQTNDAKWEITEWKDATSDKNAKTVSFKYLLTTGEADSVGTWAKTLKATDNADGTKHTGSKLLTINYDNKSPVLATSGNGYNIDEKIQQSNGFYTFGSVVTESPVGTTSQSGFERLAFYFTRTLGSTTNIYDPILGKSATGHTNATSELTLSEGLYWKTKTVTRNSTNLDTLTLPAADQNIRKGGIVKIGGTIYKILSVSGTTVTIDGSPLYSNPTETAYFALAQIVDNTAAEMGNTSGSDLYYTAANDVNGYYKTIYNDDGDYMVEAVQLTNLGATATWEAQINSQNIPDGPITLHYVAFDKAGNVASTSVDGFVSNNMPRIAGLKFGTDDNGNGTVEDKEMVTSWSGLYSFDKTGFVNGYSSNKDKVTELIVSNATDSDGTNAGTLDGNSVLKIKGVTKIVPEIVGGNNGVGYTYSVTKSGATTPYHEKAIYTELSTAHSDTNDIRSGLNINLSIQEMLGKPSGVTTTIEDGEKQIFEFSIWDKTDGVVMTDGKPKAEGEGRSQRAIVKMIMDVALVDTTKPTAKIKPFYWNKHGKPDTDSSGNTTSHNSIYWDDDNTALGHIELEDDLPSIFNQSSGVMDRDPKVSGMIVIDGAANDNTIIKTLRIKIPGFNGGNFFVIAERDNDGNLAPKQSGALSDTNTWACEIVSDTFTQANGNDVAFKFYWDTSKITNVAVTDVKVEVQASDRGKTTWKSGAVAYENAQTSDSSTTQTATGAETPYYKMDVVPYVTKISTTNRTASGLKDNNIRSASGKYSVIKGSTTDFVTVEGFNFKSGSVTARIVATDSLSSATTLTGSAVSNISVSDTRKFTFSNNLSKSGYLEVWANEIRALNNINNDGAKGAYTGNGSNKVTDYPNMYNREPDLYTTKNITLTDDRYIRVFDMKDTEIKNGYYPTMIMDGNDPVFGYIDLNGINKNQPGNPTRVYVDGCYQFQRAKFNATTGKTSDIEYLAGAISWDQMAMARDSAGKYFQVSAYNYNDANISLVYDKYAEQHTWLYNYRTTYTDGWGGGTGYNGYGGIFSYDSNNNAIDFESLSYGNGNLIGRYQNFRLVVKGNSETADGASVYVAYYDDNTTNKDVVFRTLKVGQDTSWRNTNTLKNGYSNCPDKNTSGRITVGSNASSYLDLGVTNSNIPVVVYYDINDSRLKLKYASAAVDGSTITPNITWTASSVVFPEYVGNYVTMYIDSNDHIHIAAFNTSDSDLVYMYLDSYNSSEFKSVTVDQANSVGYWTQIKVKNNVPYIAYYNSTETGSRESIKYAYFNGTITSKNDVKSGVDGNGYTTGDWEYITVPSLTPAQGGDAKFKCVNIDFDSSGRPVVGYLGTNIEFGKALDE